MNVYTISTQALDKLDSALFKSMLQLTQRQLNAVWNVDESAKVVLVDIEYPDGKAFWESPTNSSLLMIAYARQNLNHCEWFLQKPIRVQPLINLLNALATEMTKQSLQAQSIRVSENEKRLTMPPLATPMVEKTRVAETAPPVMERNSATVSVSSTIPVKPTATPPITAPTTIAVDNTFNPSKYLLGLLQLAVFQKQARRLRCIGLPPLYILPQEQCCFVTPFDPNRLDSTQKMLYNAHAEHIESVNLSPEELKQEAKQLNLICQPLERILWLATLHASRGRLINERARDGHFRLKQWPNFLNLPHDPKHVNIAAFMLKHTADLKTVAAQTRMLLPTVIDFFNACQVIGLILEEKGIVPPVTEKNLSDQKRQLFKNILNKLLNK